VTATAADPAAISVSGNGQRHRLPLLRDPFVAKVTDAFETAFPA
jgi:hypothetical protein